jgi:hypothetical protein
MLLKLQEPDPEMEGGGEIIESGDLKAWKK